MAVDTQLPIKINEVFFSIQGESSLVGWPTVFLRTSGCNIRCTYCDTKYSYYEGEKQTIQTILEKTMSYGAHHVCVTGGEPMAQKYIHELLTALCDNGHAVSLETNGAFDCGKVDSRVVKVIDIKTPGSNEEKSFDFKNLECLLPHDQVKFVICSQEDYEWSKNFISQYDLVKKCTVYFSPSFEEITPKLLAEKILQDKLQVRLQLQLHKYIWSPQLRGV